MDTTLKKPFTRVVPSKKIFLKAFIQAVLRLHPLYLIRNPVIFVAYVGSLITTGLGFITLHDASWRAASFTMHVSFWLWLTVIFANFAETVAEGKGKAQAETLKKSRHDIVAKKIRNSEDRKFEKVLSTDLNCDDLVYVEAGDVIPSDGQVVMGVASVDESAITGESAPVIRESGGDRDGVTGGTVILSDWLVIRITCKAGESFLDKMIGLVEGAKRQKTPNEIALSILLAGMTLIFLIVVITLLPFSMLSVELSGQGQVISLTVLIALLICLIPTTIGGLLSAIGIAGMDRLLRHNVIAMSGRAVEAAGDIGVVLLDKTGTITFGNRQANAFYPATGVSIEEIAHACELSSLADETPEGRSIVQLAREKYNIMPTNLVGFNATFIPFSAETRMSGVDWNNIKIRKGAVDKIIKLIEAEKGEIDSALIKKCDEMARLGKTPLLVSSNNKLLGAIELKDIIKPGIKAKLAQLRTMGIKSVMITGDNKLTAATIANEAGVDDFYAESHPEVKLNLIQEYQKSGHLVAMVGDGTNDAPALAQTDVAVVMNSGTQAAKEAANMIDLDSDPTKLLDIVIIGKQLLITRGALTTFSIANDVAKYFAIIPAAFSNVVPGLLAFNIMKLSSPYSAILSAVIFNALIIIFLIPLALRGVTFRACSADRMLLNNAMIYGLGGVFVPFVGIKLIDVLLSVLGIG